MYSGYNVNGAAPAGLTGVQQPPLVLGQIPTEVPEVMKKEFDIPLWAILIVIFLILRK